MQTESTVYLVDDDPQVRETLQRLLRSEGYKVALFPSAERFLESTDPGHPGCVLVDVRMPGMSGLELLRTMRDQDRSAPVIILTGYGDVPTAVRAMEGGASGFVEKPFNIQELMNRVRDALAEDAEIRREKSRRAEARAHAAQLTRREREVMRLVVAGEGSKQIAAELKVSMRTVEVHRRSIMKKMGVESLAELVSLAVEHRLCEAQ